MNQRVCKSFIYFNSINCDSEKADKRFIYDNIFKNYYHFFLTERYPIIFFVLSSKKI